jgi:hypothetical protein
MAQMKDLQAANDRLSAEVQNLRTAPVPTMNIKLPSKEQLDAMPQSEALALLAGELTGQMTAALQSQRGPLEQQIGVLQHNLNAVRKVEAENALKARFPRLDLEKVRPAFEAKLVANRSLSFEDAVRLVAEPADLLPAESKPTTPAPSVHIETGLPTGSAASAAPATKEPTDAEIIAQATAALRGGDTYKHKTLMAEAVKRRLNFATAPG